MAACDVYLLGVHLVLANGGGIDGLERTCAYVKGDEFGGDAFGAEFVEDALGEVEPCSGCRHGSLMEGIDGLVAFVVAALGFAVQIGWQWDDAYLLKQGGKVVASSPMKRDYPGVADGFLTFCRECTWLSVDGEGMGEGFTLPFLVVAYKAEPLAAFGGFEGLRDGHVPGFETEDFDNGTCGFLEEKSCVDDFRVVEYQ